MTVGARLKQTIASLKSVEGTIATFASVEPDNEASAVYKRNSDRIKRVVSELEKRLAAVEFEEPQYKGL
ncbi:MAG: DUF1657 domain-containing protein [Bacillota bacterium]